MKKLLPILLALLILTGCVMMPEASSTYPSLSLLPSKAPSGTTAPPTQPTQPAQPECNHTQDQYDNVDKDAFYASYTTACCWEEAQLRSEAGLMSGMLEVPQQMFTRASY